MYIADSECVIWIHMMILSVKVIEWFFPCGSYYDQRLRQTWWPSRGKERKLSWRYQHQVYKYRCESWSPRVFSSSRTDGSLAISICLIAAPGIKIQVHDILRLSYWKLFFVPYTGKNMPFLTYINLSICKPLHLLKTSVFRMNNYYNDPL